MGAAVGVVAGVVLLVAMESFVKPEVGLAQEFSPTGFEVRGRRRDAPQKHRFRLVPWRRRIVCFACVRLETIDSTKYGIVSLAFADTILRTIRKCAFR